MLEQNLPVLIFAQSGRFLAQSATQAGFTVWVADCFGDVDTLSVVDRWQKIPKLEKLTQTNILTIFSELTLGEPCFLICGSGVESYYPILNELPDNIQLIGNSGNTIHNVRTPALFFNLLNTLDIPYPPTRYSQPESIENWLVKSPSGLGGRHIQRLKVNFNATDHYYQQHITGINASCLFLANGKQANILSINRQRLCPNKQSLFTLGSIETPWLIPQQHQYQLEEIIKQLTVETYLLGLNSIDFIVSEQNELLILEVNPRPSASVELIESERPIANYHINACLGVLPENSPSLSIVKSALFYLFARTEITIPADMIWPDCCHDLPKVGITVKEEEPICTVIIQAANFQMAKKKYNLIETKIYKQFLQ